MKRICLLFLYGFVLVLGLNSLGTALVERSGLGLGISLAQEPKQTPDNLNLSQTLLTSNGSRGPVFNGDAVTYTIRLSNDGTDTISNMVIVDKLPLDALFNITCLDDCQTGVITETVVDPDLGPVVITLTSELIWTADTLAPGQSLERRFTGQVGCQVDGASIDNTVFVDYVQSGTNRSDSVTLQTTARAAFFSGQGFNTVPLPIWCSTGIAGVYDLDWGDFDQDGDFDLALASIGGTSVYQNQNKQLSFFWKSSVQNFGVRWADLIPQNGSLELLTIGDGPVAPNNGAGTNYVYQFANNTFEQTNAFVTESTLFHLDLADANADGHLDMAVTNLNPQGTCLARLYLGNGNGEFPSNTCLLLESDITASSSPKAKAIAWGDYNNDGRPDVAIGGSKNDGDSFVEVRVQDSGGGFLNGASLTGLSGTGAEATSLAWGDYNRDGYLDLALGFRQTNGSGEVYLYPNNGSGGFGSALVRGLSSMGKPLALAWADLNRDGWLDLGVGDTLPRLYLGPGFGSFLPLVSTEIEGHIWRLRLVDYDNSNSLDVAFSNRDSSSSLYNSISGHLDPNLNSVRSLAADSVAWGDANADGLLDLLFGASASVLDSELYYNSAGSISSAGKFTFSGFGPRQVAFGDVDGDRDLDVVFGDSGTSALFIYNSDQNSYSPDGWTNNDVTRAVAWGDVDGDGDLDLLLGNDGVNRVYLNSGSGLESSPLWTSSNDDDSRTVVWADYNRDSYLDFAVGNYNGRTRVYCNRRDNTFTLAWQSTSDLATTSVAWGDYDGDGDLDLAQGNYQQANQIYANNTCQNFTCSQTPLQPDEVTCPSSNSTLDSAPIWSADDLRKTNSLAWGDWNNDGDLDLAVGNDGEPDEVFANAVEQSDLTGATPFYLSWQSNESYETTALAWGDPDQDGDLDLAISQAGSSGQSGIYINTSRQAAQFADNYAPSLPLPQNPVYLKVAQPGQTSSADFLSSAELLSGSTSPTISISINLFDSNGSRASTSANTSGQVLALQAAQYSLNGGGNWYTATLSNADSVFLASRQGQTATLIWNAQGDQAIGDNVRFRATFRPYLGTHALSPNQAMAWPQFSTFSATSPPFRVRGLSCTWPTSARISYTPTPPIALEDVRFEGIVDQASGMLDYMWDFGDNSDTVFGPAVFHQFSSDGLYLVTLTVVSPACPIAHEVIATAFLTVGAGAKTYLPLIQK